MTDERTLAEFPEMNPGPVLRVDPAGTILLANAAARSLFEVDSLVGRSWLELCPGLDDGGWRSVLEATEPVRHETRIKDRCLIFTLAHRASGEEVFVYGSDITDLKLAQEQMARQAAELSEMARFPEMNPGPVCRLETDSCIILANRAARRLFDRNELVGLRWLDLCPGMTPALWDHIINTTDLVFHEARINGRDLLFTHTPGAGGHNVFAYGSDVTDQKIAERALLQSDKMATLGTLAAGVAHELNNPAAAAQRAAEQLRAAFIELRSAELELRRLQLADSQVEKLAALDERVREAAACGCDLDPVARSDREGELGDWLDRHGFDDSWQLAAPLVELEFEQADLDELAAELTPATVRPVITWLSRAQPVYSLLEEIRHGAARVSEMVGALKTYSYVGQAPVQAVDINDGLRQTLIILRNKLKAGVTVEREFAEDLPRIQAYGSELNQVWTNLIDNAAQAMDGHGRLVIRTRRAGGWVVIEVEDDGPGIPADIRPRIFDPFFTTKPLGQGTGLGLNTSYNLIVQRHRGRIEVESEPGCTRFVVSLPIDAEPDMTVAPANVDDANDKLAGED